MEKLKSLIQTAHQLRAPGGCPWDAEQDHRSLVQYLLEETYELIDAIESGSRAEVLEELGDVLYQVIFHSDLASEGTLGEPFDLEDVAEYMEKKMRSRHPHVFGSDQEIARFKAETGDDVMQHWEGHKKKEKPDRTSILDGIPQAMPALALANKVMNKAEKIGILEKSEHPAIPMESEDDLGKLLLAIVASARSAGLDPERALREATKELQVEIRAFELNPDNDAGVIGLAD
ncbi:MazG family protein [Candidatus Aquiluna sp. UB-MaderosW2red]|uniref:MazG family protein n=1 Tax=Candidatus Aquiluna sp. UB-MaderosW2red TaxID=1855377 RepID=UPI000875E03E|nr:MazG family protein [Candidatus Aquiluna sp. UB-MaderosW2red]SCX08750.1 XTP/dITP diphosphohydrolase [Candidatus Aquiluna sp. UB-MaderosW2red]